MGLYGPTIREACECPERKKPTKERNWVVDVRNANYSAFKGYRRTFSDYSQVRCKSCGKIWRTKANYVNDLKNENVSGR